MIADEALARIVKATGHTGYIAMLDRTEVLGLRMRPGSKPLRVVTSPGDRLPAFCSSTGRAMLARLDDEAVRALYPAPLQPPSPNAPQTIDDLLAALATVREKGWSQATDEILPGVESIAVCVDDRDSVLTAGPDDAGGQRAIWTWGPDCADTHGVPSVLMLQQVGTR